MVLKSLGKKAKSLVKGKKADKAEAPAPTRPAVQAPAKGDAAPNGVPLHGWKGGKASGPKGEAKIGKDRGEGATWKKADKPGKPQGPAVIGKKDEPKAATWQAGSKGQGPQGPALLGAKRTAPEGAKAPQNTPGGYLNQGTQAPSPYLNALPLTPATLKPGGQPETTAYTLSADGTHAYGGSVVIDREVSSDSESSDEWEVKRDEGTSAFQHSNPDELGPEYVDSGAVSESVASDSVDSDSQTASSEVGSAVIVPGYQNADIMGGVGVSAYQHLAMGGWGGASQGASLYQNQVITNAYKPQGYNPLRDGAAGGYQNQVITNAYEAQAPQAQQALPPGYIALPPKAPEAQAPQAPQALPPGYLDLNAPKAQAPQALPPGYLDLNAPKAQAPQALPPGYLDLNAPKAQAPQAPQALPPGYLDLNAPKAQAPQAPQALPPGYLDLNAPKAQAPQAPQALPPGYLDLNAPKAQAPQAPQALPPGYLDLNAPKAQAPQALPPGYLPPQAPQQQLPPGYLPPQAPQALPPGYLPPQAPQQQLPPGYLPPTTQVPQGQNATLGYQNQAITNAYTPPGYNPMGTIGGAKTGYSNPHAFLEPSAPSQLISSSTISSSSEELPEVKDQRPITYTATKAPNVQPVTPASKDEGVAKMQTDLRRGARYNNKDVPERRGYSSIDVNRADLSKTEQKSQGWANLAIRDTYKNQRQWDGSIKKGYDRDLLGTGTATQYYITKAMKLDEEARKVLASNLKAGKATKREDTVLKFQGGVFVDAKGEAVDTTHVEALNQSIHELSEKLTSKMDDARAHGLASKLQKLAGQLDELRSVNQQAAARKAGIAGRYIYVMNSAGEFFAGKSINGVVHHSSFLAGGAVAGAGEVAISGGKLTAISNTSGHYRPGPAYLWQAVKQLEMLGVPLESVRVDVMGVPKPFKSAAEFLGAFNPAEDPEMFDSAKAIAHLKAYLDKKSADKKLEKAALEQAEDVKAEGGDGPKKPKQ